MPRSVLVCTSALGTIAHGSPNVNKRQAAGPRPVKFVLLWSVGMVNAAKRWSAGWTSLRLQPTLWRGLLRRPPNRTHPLAPLRAGVVARRSDHDAKRADVETTKQHDSVGGLDRTILSDAVGARSGGRLGGQQASCSGRSTDEESAGARQPPARRADRASFRRLRGFARASRRSDSPGRIRSARYRSASRRRAPPARPALGRDRRAAG